MIRTVTWVLAVLLLIAVIGFAVYQTPAGQDALFERAVTTMLVRTAAPPEGLQVVVCGSASPLGNDPDRAQACIAVLTPEHFFLFDTGARSPLRMAEARLPMDRLDGVFLTHFHSDHIASLPDVNLNSWVQGRRDSLRVYGPPGVEDVIRGFNLAYSPDRGYRVAHHGADLLPPAAGPMTAVGIGSGDQIAWQDDLLTVTAFPVRHDPVEPALGYRVDYRDRSVVISGDTVATDSLFTAAAGADLLLHDALSRTLLDPMIEAARAGAPRLARIMTDVIDYHADSRSLEERARAAGVRQLAYYHLVPVPPNALAEKLFARGLSPDTVLVRDLHTFDLPTGSTDILVHAP